MTATRKHYITIELSTPYRVEVGPTVERDGVWTTEVYVVPEVASSSPEKAECPRCDGSGKEPNSNDFCAVCDGDGWLDHSELAEYQKDLA